MSLKSVWLDRRQLVELRRLLNNVGSNDLLSELDDFLDNNDDDGGAYIVNVFSNYCFVELQRLDELFGVSLLLF